MSKIRVRTPGRARSGWYNGQHDGGNLSGEPHSELGDVAHLVERLDGIEEAAGSSPALSTRHTGSAAPAAPVTINNERRCAMTATHDTQLDAGTLTTIVMADDPGRTLADHWSTVAAHIPELAALDMDQGGRTLHKDNVAHTIAVVAKMPAELRLRLVALFHDVGKPPTRRIDGSTVTFHGHEQLGGRLTRDIMRRLGYDETLTGEVAAIVEMSGSTKDSTGWTDSAVRRFAGEAGDLLDDLLTFAALDVTSRHEYKHVEVREQVDRLRAHIAAVRARDIAAARRPVVDGQAIMDRYGLVPGPQVGALMRILRDADMWTGGDATVDDAWALLDAAHAASA